MLKYTKEELEELIFIKKVSYRELGRINDVSDTYIKAFAKKLGIVLPTRAKFPDRWIPFNKGKTKITGIEEFVYIDRDFPKCKYCGEIIKKKANKFCSFTCMGKYEKSQTKLYYEDCVKNDINITNYGNIHTFKSYILEEQKNRCEICHNDSTWNDKELVLVLDHIDGDASNNKRPNLRCICPNCDSQLDTYKRRNKNSARKDRYLLNYKNFK